MMTTRTSPTLIGAAIVSSCLALTACSSGGDAGEGSASGEVSSITVVDTYTDSPDKEIYQGVLEECAAEVGVGLDRQTIPNQNLISKVLQMSSSKTLPDLLMLDNPDVQQIAATGALTPVTDFGLSGDGFTQGVLDASTYDGDLYALQPVTNTLALFYNKDLFEAAGVEVPTDWTELRAAAEALTGGDTYGLAFSANASFEGTWQFLPFMWSAGAQEDDLTSDAAVEALTLWADLVQGGSASASVVNWSQADVNDQFVAGKAAMMINGPWQLSLLADAGTNFGIAPVPGPQKGDTAVAPLGGEAWTLPQTGDAARQQAAADVLGCLTSDDNQVDLSEQRNTLPTKTAALGTFNGSHPELQAFSDLIIDARARTALLGDEWPSAATQIYTAIQSALVGGLTPAEALAQAVNG